MLDKLREQRAAKRSELDGLLNIEGRDATPEESTRCDDLLTELRALDGRIESLEALEAREAKVAEARKGEEKPEERGAAPVATVTNEPRVYTRESGNSWFSDAYRAQYMGDSKAAERLTRYSRENEVEKRDVGTSAFGALIPPQYLVDLFAPIARAGRPVANTVNQMALPTSGMTLEIPRGTTGTAVAAQATQNSAVQETDFDETTLTVNVRTIAGQQDIARQALERASGNDEIIFADLVSAYASELDRQIIAGDGTSGTHLGLLETSGAETVTYTDAAPTVGALYAKLADAVQRVNSLRFMPASVIWMHPRRWGWFTAALDGSDRPLVVPSVGAPQNAVGVGEAAQYGQVVGQLLGLPVVTDANIPTGLGAGTDEDAIIVARAADVHLWESSPVPSQLKFEETTAGSLTVKLVVYGYSAFTSGRYPKAVSVVTGTGLVAPSF